MDIQTICTIIQTTFIVAGVATAVISLLADHKRRKGNATLELYGQFSKEIDELQHEIRKIFPDIVNPEDKLFKDDENIQKKISRLLSIYAEIAVGVNYKVWDLNVYAKMAGYVSIRWYNRLRLVIDKRRKEIRPTIHKEFYDLAESMKKYLNHPKNLKKLGRFVEIHNLMR